mgnify:FL=1
MMKMFSVLVIGCLLFTACGGGGTVSVYHRADVDTASSRIVVFPMLLCQGQTISAANGQYSNPVADVLLTKSWAGALGADNAISIPKLAFDKIPKANEFINLVVRAADEVSAVEQTGAATDFLNGVRAQFGDGALAFALVFEDKAAYESSKAVHLNMGLFDVKKMTWKWITKHAYKAGLAPVPYEKVVSDLVDESFKALREKAGALR